MSWGNLAATWGRLAANWGRLTASWERFTIENWYYTLSLYFQPKPRITNIFCHRNIVKRTFCLEPFLLILISLYFYTQVLQKPTFGREIDYKDPCVFYRKNMERYTGTPDRWSILGLNVPLPEDELEHDSIWVTGCTPAQQEAAIYLNSGKYTSSKGGSISWHRLGVKNIWKREIILRKGETGQFKVKMEVVKR